MRKSIALSCLLLVALFFVPWLLAEEREAPPPLSAEETEEGMAESGAPERPSADGARTLRVKLGGRVEEMTMETYLRGVLRGEMPASFESEALKAQAVAARTYTLHKINGGGSPNHPEADACDDITCCKAYLAGEEAARNWGMAAVLYEEKICAAVAETDGEVVLYEEEPVLAVFHASSAGATRPAGEVWQRDLPYLQSVPSPEDETTVPDYRSEVSFPYAAFKALVEEARPGVDLSGAPSDWFTAVKQGESGAVLSLRLGGEEFSGTELRALLGLRSASFTVDFTDTAVVFSVTGYGHGVGMSQYGANVMAKAGKTYREILGHYYVGTAVGQYG